MAAPKGAWGIEIGADAIKAIRLERDGDKVGVSDFAVIPHKKVLTTPDLDQDEMVRLSLGQFISQKSLEGEHLVMSVPGHAAFARFAKLPPVEPKKVPDIVKFEAVQQIPFPIDEVEWDYQTFTSEDSPEVEVGIFAITRDRVQQRLGLYGELGVSPEALTLSPVALYNAMAYDLGLAANKDPVIFLDIGTQATDVVIAEEGRCWIRTFPLGGTHFTEAIANAFKLSYSKADKLKKEASTSKYAKQIMQAMRPVFSDLLQDLQRSIGYYQSLHRDHELGTMVGIGSTFKIPGLRKFIGQQLQINVVRLDEYKKITVVGREAAAFAEHAVNMATAYGLALQGVGLAQIDANLVPVKSLREQMWQAKTKWFAAAAAIIVVGAATTLYHPLTDRGLLAPTPPTEVENVLRRGKQLKDEFQEAQRASKTGHSAENMRRLVDYRTVWPNILVDASTALAAANPQPELLGHKIDEIREIPPGERRLVELEDLSGIYVPPLDQNGTRRIQVTMAVKFSHEDKIEFLNDKVATWLRDNAEPIGDRSHVPYRILVDTIKCNPASLETLEVDAEGGETSTGGSGRSGVRKPPPPPTAPGRPAAPPRTPPGGIGSSGGGGGGFGFTGAGDTGGRRSVGKKRKAPGSGIGSTAGAGAGGFGVSPPPVGGTRTGGSPTGGSAKSGEGYAAIDAMAPMPDRPSTYPPDSTFYRVPITFEVEIRDARKMGDASMQASAKSARDGGDA